MQAAQRQAPPRQGHIQLLLFERILQRGLAQLFGLRLEGSFQRLFHRIGALANHRLLFFCELPELSEDVHQPRIASQMRHPPGFQCGFI